MMNSNNYLISYRTLRQLIGWLGVLLPFLCWGVNAMVNRFGLLNNPLLVDKDQSCYYIAGADLKSSISHFYYTAAGPLFTGILITVSIFLFCYTGHPEKKADDRWSWLTDRRVATFAASSALGIVFFPTGSMEIIKDNIHTYVASSVTGNIHFVFAASFFLAMALMSLVNFRRRPARQMLADAEGKVYLVCGCGMLLCLLVLFASLFITNSGQWLWGRFVYVMEVIMLLLFGIAWLVKGKSVPTEFILKKLQ
jgi:amino acid transporter